MRKVPKISVLITYYREKELLRRCLDSLLQQPTAVCEILIHDDASPERAADFLSPSPLIRVIRAEKNRGPSTARNTLLAEAKGDYVHFHDADDFFSKEWAWQVSEAIAKSSPDILFTEANSYKYGQLHRAKMLDLRLVQGGMHLVDFCLNYALLPLAGTYRKSLLEKLGGYRDELWQSEDFEFHARLALAEPKYEILAEPLVCIDVRDDSRSKKQLEVWNWRLNALRLLFLDLPPTFYPAFVEAASKAGSQLYKLGDDKSAKAAFALAAELGNPSFDGRPLPFRWLAKIIGPARAERLGKHYRGLLPETVRQRIRDSQTKSKRKAS